MLIKGAASVKMLGCAFFIMNSGKEHPEIERPTEPAISERINALESALTRLIVAAPGTGTGLTPFIRNLLERSVDLVYVIAEDASFMDVNEAACQLLGYSVDEMRALKISDVDIIYDSVNWQTAFRRLRKLHSYRIETLERSREGEIYPVELTLNYVTHNGTEMCVAIGHDITERKKVENALRASEEKYRAVVEDQVEMICRFVPDGTITFANNAFCQLYGKTTEEIIGRSYLSLVPEPQYPVFTRFIEELLSEPERIIFDIQPYRSGDNIIWMEQTMRALTAGGDNVQKFQVVLRDVTDRKKAEQALRESHEQYRLIFDRMQDGFAVFEILYGDNNDVTDARFLEVNPAFQRITGIRGDETVGKTMWEVFPTMRLATVDQWKSLVTNSRNMIIEEFYSVSLDKYLRISGMSLNKGRYAVLVSDTTEHKQMVEKLLRTDRLSSLGEMAAGLVHEISNPLTGVMALSQVMKERTDIPDQVRNDAEGMFREANRAADILKDFLIFARGKKPNKQKADVNSIVESVLNLRRSHMKKNGIEVHVNFAGDLPELLLDISQIQQVFINVILNAEYFMYKTHGSGLLDIKTKCVGDRVRVSIKDNGPGIEPQCLSHMFDPFYSTKESGQGTGLGLSISYGIIEEHGGNIFAKSKPGHGATFFIELPISSTASE